MKVLQKKKEIKHPEATAAQDHLLRRTDIFINERFHTKKRAVESAGSENDIPK